jgi:Flp pilus assembly protein TadD
MFNRSVTGAVIAAAVIVLLGCGGRDGGGLSPASEYRKRQIDAALAGVAVVDGRLVAEPAPPLAPPEIRGRLAEVDALLDRGLRPAAVAAAVAVVRGAPGSADACVALGRALLTTGRNDVAVAAFATAVALEPRDADARFLLGAALDRSGHDDRAVTAWHEALAIDPGLGAAHVRLAAAAWLAGDVGEAAVRVAAAQAAGTPLPGQLARLVPSPRWWPPGRPPVKPPSLATSR